MNYQKIYDQIILRAQSESRKKVKDGVYFENHHIIPVCLDGSNKKDNLVLLTAREHFVAHKLLVEIYPDNSKLKYALWMLITAKGNNQQRYTRVSSREYSRVKEEFSKICSIRMSGENHPMYDVHRFGELAPNWGKKGELAPFYKHNHSKETKLKMHYSSVGVPKSEEHKQHMKDNHADFSGNKSSLFGKDHSGDNNPFYGKNHSEETILKLKVPKSEAHKQKLREFNLSLPYLDCPHCGKVGRGSSMKRYHFENCRFKSSN